MGATLKQLRDQIIIDAGIEGHPKFPTVRLNRIVNLSQRYVQTELNGLGSKCWERSQDATAGLAAGTFNSGSTNCKTITIGNTYFPNMLESPNSIMFIDVSDDTSHGIAYEVGPKEFAEQLANTYLAPTISDPVFMRLAGKVYLAPSSIIGATPYYYKGITDLVQDSDVSEMPVEFEEFVIKKAVMEIDYINGKLNDKAMAESSLSKDINSAYEKFLGKQVEQNRPKMNDKAKLQ